MAAIYQSHITTDGSFAFAFFVPANSVNALNLVLDIGIELNCYR